MSDSARSAPEALMAAAGNGPGTRCQTAFLAMICRNHVNRTLLDVLPRASLPDCWLVAGCLFQTVWNVRAGRPPAENIRDYDVFYHDPDDLSWAAEDRAIRNLHEAVRDVPARVELRNQARVHLWYADRFGEPCPPLRTSRDGIDRFLIDCTRVAIGVGPADHGKLYAPGSLADLYAGILRPTPGHHSPALFMAKAESYRARWPWLRIGAAA